MPPEALIPKYQLQDLCAEAAKLKTLGAMESIPATRLVKLLNILEKNIRDGARVSPIADPVSLNWLKIDNYKNWDKELKNFFFFKGWWWGWK